MKDTYTIVVMSSSDDSVHQHSISRIFFTFLIILASVVGLGVVASIGFGVYANSKFTKIQNEKQALQEQIALLDTQIEDRETQINFHEKKWEEIRGMVKTVRYILGLDETGVLSQGGGGDTSTPNSGGDFDETENGSSPSPNVLGKNSDPLQFAETPELIPQLQLEIGVIYDAAIKDLQRFEQTPFILPIRISGKEGESYYTSSSYGYRTHPITKRRHFHNGIDIATRSGTPVIATANGVISERGYDRGGFGNMIRIDHKATGYQTLYGHLLKFAKVVKVGKKVVRGEVIGYVGSSGLSTGSHLHYGVYTKNKHQNPNYYIIKP